MTGRLPMSEDQLTRSVVELVATVGARIAHFRPAWTSKGYRTAVQGNGGKGFPDAVIWGPGGVLFRELKRDGEYPSPEQRLRLAELEQAGADVGVWRPRDWHEGRIRDEVLAVAGRTARRHGV